MKNKQRKPWKTNPFCRRCRMPMKKKGTVKLGESRYRCPKCRDER